MAMAICSIRQLIQWFFPFPHLFCGSPSYCGNVWWPRRVWSPTVSPSCAAKLDRRQAVPPSAPSICWRLSPEESGKKHPGLSGEGDLLLLLDGFFSGKIHGSNMFKVFQIPLSIGFLAISITHQQSQDFHKHLLGIVDHGLSEEKSQANHVSSTLCQNKAISTQKPKVWTFFEGQLKVKHVEIKVFLKKTPTNIACSTQVTLTENQIIIVKHDWRTKTKCILGLVWKSGTPPPSSGQSSASPDKRNHTLRGYPLVN